VAIAEGPAIEGIASGTIKGSESTLSVPKAPSGCWKISRIAMRNRITPPAIFRRGIGQAEQVENAAAEKQEKQQQSESDRTFTQDHQAPSCGFEIAQQRGEYRNIADRVHDQQQH